MYVWERPVIRLSAMVLLVGTAMPTACGEQREESPPVALEVIPTSSGFGLSLNASPHVKINARLRPTLDLEDGSSIFFVATRVTLDSAYFAESPRAILPGAPARLAGTLRVSICSDTATYCQSVKIPIDVATRKP